MLVTMMGIQIVLMRVRQPPEPVPMAVARAGRGRLDVLMLVTNVTRPKQVAAISRNLPGG